MKSRRDLPAFWRALLAFALGVLLPGSGRRLLYRLLLGYTFDQGASLGRAFIRVGALHMGEDSRIGHFTIIRNVDRVSLGKNARIGTFNWIYGFPAGPSKHFAEEADRASELILEEQSSLTSRHIVDCTNRVTIGAFSTVAGFYSQILTHGIDIRTGRQTSRPITIGRYCLIGSGSLILKGSVVPEGAVVAAGSTFRGTPEQQHCIYSGIPAVPTRELEATMPYFTRSTGPID